MPDSLAAGARAAPEMGRATTSGIRYRHMGRATTSSVALLPYPLTNRPAHRGKRLRQAQRFHLGVAHGRLARPVVDTAPSYGA